MMIRHPLLRFLDEDQESGVRVRERPPKDQFPKPDKLPMCKMQNGNQRYNIVTQ